MKLTFSAATLSVLFIVGAGLIASRAEATASEARFATMKNAVEEVYRDVKAEDTPKAVEKLLKAYVANRASPDETFLAFSRRHDGESLRKMADAETCA